ncbi:hypothetical protein F511_34720 [Dorcoceras hygrometricum]|uniref:Uncharacterized protein n=1 Tax=Dorcoceras hygrometricum TaxID=472368 RepID=A0A2Z7BR07_9LAMI|nr:hypothetical protein F511_34720 [Dorcoceras hygrometricum]
MHASYDPSLLPAFGRPNPADLAGAPPAGPPSGPAGPNMTSPGLNHEPHGSNEASQGRRASRTRESARANLALPASSPDCSPYGPPLALPRTTLNQAMVPRTCLNRSHA